MGGRFCVNAFHGYAHNFACQKEFHPLYIPGVGLEDLETLERMFSGSNSLARQVRYASRYHRHLWIEEYFCQWDEDKYEQLGTFIFNNYVQALDVLKEESVLEEGLHELKLTEDDLVGFLNEERAYMLKPVEEAKVDVLKADYVIKLQQLKDLRRAPKLCLHCISIHCYL
jgi:hypothetical protein